jgi:hypothetical protein
MVRDPVLISTVTAIPGDRSTILSSICPAMAASDASPRMRSVRPELRDFHKA